ITGQRWRIDNLAWIEEPVRIERLLDCTEGIVKHRSKHLAEKGTAYQTVSVLSGQCAAKFENEIRHFIGYRFKLADPVSSLEIDYRTDVETSDGCVRIDSRARFVLTDDGEKSFDVVAQFFRRDGGVFDEGDRLRLVLHRH